MDLRKITHRTLGSFLASRSAAEICRIRVPDRVVVGRREGHKDRIALVTRTSRRNVLKAAAGAAASLALARAINPGFVQAQEAERHGMSAFGDLKYPADFKHFSYVNPNAPKGGLF